jgi:hypothetical protein
MMAFIKRYEMKKEDKTGDVGKMFETRAMYKR